MGPLGAQQQIPRGMRRQTEATGHAKSSNGIQNTINNLIIYVDEIDAYFIIDKKNLPIELRLGTEIKIKKINIPTESKIKRFMVGWN